MAIIKLLSKGNTSIAWIVHFYTDIKIPCEKIPFFVQSLKVARNCIRKNKEFHVPRIRLCVEPVRQQYNRFVDLYNIGIFITTSLISTFT